MTQESSATPTNPELEWIQMRQAIGSVDVETTKEKFLRKIKSNPLVPIGCLATSAALGFGLYSFRKGEKKMSQMMMRTRIVAQGFTVAALIVGVIATFGGDNNTSSSDNKNN